MPTPAYSLEVIWVNMVVPPDRPSVPAADFDCTPGDYPIGYGTFANAVASEVLNPGALDAIRDAYQRGDRAGVKSIAQTSIARYVLKVPDSPISCRIPGR